MRIIAHTGLDPDSLRRFEQAFPEADFLHVALENAERLATERNVGALLVTEQALGEQDATRLAVLKARIPSLVLLAYLPPTPALAQQVKWLRQARADRFLVRGIEDDAEQLRDELTAAAMTSLACAFERASSPSPPLLVAPNLELALRRIGGIKSPGGWARALSASLQELRHELWDAGLFPPRRSLAWLRLAAAGRRLGDGAESAETIARAVGYGTAITLRNSFHHLASTAPLEVRGAGGLGFVLERYQSALAAWRRRRAA